MKSQLNSKRLPGRLEELKQRAKKNKEELAFPSSFKKNPPSTNLDRMLKGYRDKEAKLLQEIDRMLEEPYAKETQDKLMPDIREHNYGAKKVNLRNKSSMGFPKTSNATLSDVNVQNRPMSKQSETLKPPFVTAKNWLTINADNKEIIYGYKIYEEKEVASITKLMTCLIVLDFIEKYNIDIDKTHYLVSRKAAQLGGTTANLKKDDYVCVRDLLFGMMLPSGNDASQTLAENIITHKYILDKHKNCDPNEISYDEEVPADKNLEGEFYWLMNRKARELQLLNTNYDSSHGLMNEDNFSCCYDQARLSVEALSYPLLQEIVGTPIYTGVIERNDRDCELVWKNTNKLLDKRGYKGIKTGITHKAGGCLATYFSGKGVNLITVVLGSRDQHMRFTDTEAVNSWVTQNFKEIMSLPLHERVTE
jgi:D-alanyl-D-alanine carboxypeptidase (penicillin-binding protein 5/6)